MLPNDAVFMFTGRVLFVDWPWRTRVEVQQAVSLSRLWIGADATYVMLTWDGECCTFYLFLSVQRGDVHYGDADLYPYAMDSCRSFKFTPVNATVPLKVVKRGQKIPSRPVQ